jgi:hypothetical protein
MPFRQSAHSGNLIICTLYCARTSAAKQFRLHPDGKELGVQAPLFRTHTIEVAVSQPLGKIELFVNQTLGRVGVHINCHGASMYGKRIVRLACIVSVGNGCGFSFLSHATVCGNA